MLVDEIAKIMQMGKQTDLVLVGFSKAFNKVAHKKLISKLHFYGILGKTLSWAEDFLDSRSQVVIPRHLCRGVYSFCLFVRMFFRSLVCPFVHDSVPFVELLQSFTLKFLKWGMSH